MSRYVAKRLASSIALLFLSTIIIFLLMRVIPGDPTITKLGGSIKEVDDATLTQIRTRARARQVDPGAVRHLDLRHRPRGLRQLVLQPVLGHDADRTAHRRHAPARADGDDHRPRDCGARIGRRCDLAQPLPQRRALRIRRDRDRDPDVRDRDRADHRDRSRARRPPDPGVRLVPARPAEQRQVDAPAQRSPSGSGWRP